MHLRKAIVQICLGWVAILFLGGCGKTPASTPKSESQTESLAEARQGFTTKLLRKDNIGEAAPPPPVGTLDLISYPAPLGNLAAYITPLPTDGQKHPAIIWIVGGFSSSVGDVFWTPSSSENDQSGSVLRQPGMVVMYPSLRGGNDNPGFLEGFYGEVDDILSAIAFLKKQGCVDPHRIYLGGHSTGGTLALLVAESTDQLRSVFAFGPVSDIRSYGAENLPIDLADTSEVTLRSPGNWLAAIRTPTFVFEGAGTPSNIGELHKLAQLSQNPLIHFLPINGGTHFSILSKESRLIADKILSDTNSNAEISINQAEADAAFNRD